jgi:hypothetical protein
LVPLKKSDKSSIEKPSPYLNNKILMKKIFYIISFLFISSVGYCQYIYNASGKLICKIDGNYFYNGSGKQLGRKDENYFYNAFGNLLGRKDGDYLYDKSGSIIGRIDGDYLYDGSGKQKYKMNGDYIYNASGEQIGRGEGITKLQLILFHFYFQ